MKPKFLYFLSKNDDNSIFYIGITEKPKNRLSAHRNTYGKNITMTVFKELKCEFAECIESHIIINAHNNGLKLKNNLKVIIHPIEQPETVTSYKDFIETTKHFNELETVKGIKIVSKINKSLIHKPKKEIVRFLITMKLEEANLFITEANEQGRGTSNLIRKYINEGVKRDREFRKVQKP